MDQVVVIELIWIENAEEIIKTEGIDAIIVGPVDLSISLDVVGDIMHPKQLQSIDKVVSLCRKYNKMFGIVGSNAILDHYKEDINYFVSAVDVNIIRDGIERSVKEYDSITGRKK